MFQTILMRKGDNVSKAKVVRNSINHTTRETDRESGRWHTGSKPAGEPEGIQRGKDLIKQPGNGKNLGALQSNYQNKQKSGPQNALSSEGFLQRKPGLLCSYLEPHPSDEDNGKVSKSPTEFRASFTRKYKTEQEKLSSDHKYNSKGCS